MKPIVIAGSGPSLAQIDYRRLPESFDVFRVNNFYFEDHYWLGKDVTGYFCPHQNQLELQFYNMVELQKRNEYNIHKVYCHISFGQGDSINFPTVAFIPGFRNIYPKIWEYVAMQIFYRQLYPTMGICMLLEALNQGYTEIYLSGLDFYALKERYPFDISQNIKKLHPDRELYEKMLSVEGIGTYDPWHSSDNDASIVKIVASLKDVRLYSLSSKSPVSEFIPLAPIQNDAPYVPPKKNEGCLRDWIKNPLIIRREKEEQERLVKETKPKGLIQTQERLVKETKPKGLIQMIKAEFYSKGMQPEWDSLRNNIYLRLAYHAVKPLWIIAKFIVSKEK